MWQIRYCFPPCLTLSSAAKGAGLIICVNKKDATLLSYILNLCPSQLPGLSPCWLHLTVPPSHRHTWQSVASVLPQSHPSPTDGPDHSWSRYEAGEGGSVTTFPLYLEPISQPLDRSSVLHLSVVNGIYPLSCCLVPWTWLQEQPDSQLTLIYHPAQLWDSESAAAIMKMLLVEPWWSFYSTEVKWEVDLCCVCLCVCVCVCVSVCVCVWRQKVRQSRMYNLLI